MSLTVTGSTKFADSESDEFTRIEIIIKPHRKGGKCIEEFYLDLAQIRFQFTQEKTPTKSDSSTSSSNSGLEYIDSPRPVLTSISMKKRDWASGGPVKLFIWINALNCHKELVCPENWTEFMELGKITTNIKKINSASYKCVHFDVNLAVSKAEVFTFAKLYNDTITTDFNMSVKGGTTIVPMHRSCLLAHSDMFRTLFQTEHFIDKKDFQVGITDVTDETIQHLKDYVYLGVLPDTGLRMLLILARCYLFDNLKSECITKLARMATSEDLHSLIDFACENNIPELVIALLQETPTDVVNLARLMHKGDRKRPHTDEDTEKRMDIKRKRSN